MKKTAAAATIIAMLATFLPLGQARASASPADYLNNTLNAFPVESMLSGGPGLLPGRVMFGALEARPAPGYATVRIFPYTAPRTAIGYAVDGQDAMVTALKKGLSNFEESFVLDCSAYEGDAFGDFEGALAEAQRELQGEMGFFSIYNEIHWEKFGSTLTVRVDYMISRSQFEETRQLVSELADELVQPGMSQVEIEKAFHDYLCRHCVYDLQFQDPSYSAYGALVLGRAVCQGYSEAMGMLCLEAGLECRIVTGTARDDSGQAGDHAWNLVKIDGEYRHVDVTYDDPVRSDGLDRFSYEYFNISDAEIARDHSWDWEAYPAAP